MDIGKSLFVQIMGFRHEIKRSTHADANETRGWCILAEFAQWLIAQARQLYVGEGFAINQ